MDVEQVRKSLYHHFRGKKVFNKKLLDVQIDFISLVSWRFIIITNDGEEYLMTMRADEDFCETWMVNVPKSDIIDYATRWFNYYRG